MEAAPYWKSKPTNVDAAEGEKAEFVCIAEAIPEPVVFWFLNGVPLSSTLWQLSLSIATMTGIKLSCLQG